MSFCHYVHFFRDRPAAEAWTQNQEGGFVLDLDDAVAGAHYKIAFESRKPSVAIKEDGNKREAGNEPVSRQAPSVS